MPSAGKVWVVIEAHDKTKTGIESSKKQFKSLGDVMKTVSLGQIAALGGVSLAFGRLTQSSIEAASNLAESMNKAREVFKESFVTIEEFAGQGAEAIGASRQQIFEMTGTIGNLLTAVGLTEKQAAGMSKQILQLAADVSSFNNVPITEALNAIRSALVGESEPMRRFGADVRVTRLENLALETQLISTKKEFNSQAQALAALEAILRDTRKAQGDFQRTSEGLANSQRILKAQFQDALATLGEQLLPVVLKAVQIISDLLRAYQSLSPGLQNATATIAAFGAASLALLPTLGGISIAISGIVSLVKALSGAGGALIPALVGIRTAIAGLFAAMGPAGWLVLGFGALITALELFSDNTEIATDALADFRAEVNGLTLDQAVKELQAVEEEMARIASGQILEQWKAGLDSVTQGMVALGEVAIPSFIREEEARKMEELQEKARLLEERMQQLKATSPLDLKVTVSTVDEKKAIAEVNQFRKEQFDQLILEMAQDEIAARERISEETLAIEQEKIATQTEMFQESQEEYLSLREEFLTTDQEMEVQNLVDRLNAWNENWADLEEGQLIFNAAMAQINARFLTVEQMQWKKFTDAVSSHMVSAIGGYVIGLLDKAFSQWIDRQRGEFAKFLTFLVAEFTKAIARMAAETAALSIFGGLFGGPLGFLSSIFHEGGIVPGINVTGGGGAYSGYAHTGGIVTAPGLSRGDIIEAPGLQTGMISGGQKARPGMMVSFARRGADRIPAMLEPGEAVIPKRIVKEHYELIEQLISGETETITAMGYQAGDIIARKPIKPETMITFAPRGADTIPAMLEPGEAVIPREVVREHRELIEQLISGETITAMGYQAGDIISKGTMITFAPRGADTVPAMLEPGEAVIPREVVKEHRTLIENLINGQIEKIVAPGLQAGAIIDGRISPVISATTAQISIPISREEIQTAPAAKVNVNLNMNISAIDGESVYQLVSGREFRTAIADVINDGFLRMQAGVNVEVKY